MRLNLAPPERALAIAAHPDDVELGCGGTFAKWAAAGTGIHHLVLTDGSKGSWDPSEDVARLVEIRRREQRAAAAALGARDPSASVTFLDNVDGELAADLEQRRHVAAAIRRTRPAVVLGHDPWRRYRLHPDHRNAGLLAVEGIVAARDPHFFPDLGLEHWRPSTLLLWEADEVDHLEVLDEGAVAKKLSSLGAHASQLRSTMDVVPGDADEAQQRARFDRRVRERLAGFGRQAGAAAAEGFKRIDEL